MQSPQQVPVELSGGNADQAIAASSMALAGFISVIPLDQVINTVRIVGRSMSPDLCCTGKGGLALTPKSRELKEMLKNFR